MNGSFWALPHRRLTTLFSVTPGAGAGSPRPLMSHSGFTPRRPGSDQGPFGPSPASGGSSRLGAVSLLSLSGDEEAPAQPLHMLDHGKIPAVLSSSPVSTSPCLARPHTSTRDIRDSPRDHIRDSPRTAEHSSPLSAAQTTAADWSDLDLHMDANLAALTAFCTQNPALSGFVLVQKGLVLGSGRTRYDAYTVARARLEYDGKLDRYCVCIKK